MIVFQWNIQEQYSKFLRKKNVLINRYFTKYLTLSLCIILCHRHFVSEEHKKCAVFMRISRVCFPCCFTWLKLLDWRKQYQPLTTKPKQTIKNKNAQRSHEAKRFKEFVKEGFPRNIPNYTSNRTWEDVEHSHKCECFSFLGPIYSDPNELEFGVYPPMKRIECFSFTFNAALDECRTWPFDVSVFRKLLLAVVHTTPTSRCFLYPGDHFRKVPFSKSFTLHHLGNVAMFHFGLKAWLSNLSGLVF